MRRVVLFAAACVLCLGLAGTASAAPYGHHGRYGHHGGRAYYHTHGVRFHGGYYYPGYNHHHWSRRFWDGRYRRWNYYDPALQCWFYWAPSANAYYPVTYIVP